MNWDRYLMAVLYILAGTMHFVKPGMYKKIMPKYLPNPGALVLISGLAEIILGILLLFDATSSFAAIGLILLLIAVFPANVEMMKIYRRKRHPFFWITVLRLPLQLVLIWWAWLYV